VIRLQLYVQTQQWSSLDKPLLLTQTKALITNADQSQIKALITIADQSPYHKCRSKSLLLTQIKALVTNADQSPYY